MGSSNVSRDQQQAPFERLVTSSFTHSQIVQIDLESKYESIDLVFLPRLLMPLFAHHLVFGRCRESVCARSDFVC